MTKIFEPWRVLDVMESVEREMGSWCSQGWKLISQEVRKDRVRWL